MSLRRGRHIHVSVALKLHPIFNKSGLGKELKCHLVQSITRHGHNGEYFTQFHPGLNRRCSCGEWVETIAPCKFGLRPNATPYPSYLPSMPISIVRSLTEGSQSSNTRHRRLVYHESNS
ncbi:hypothetical protein AG1IA_06314 [Rhizoctonia solani AG-1 IA]|uniref:Uncharacterized protein n=1 Tax=Thanatephorus cucumeris (strain AG1-IA) TaxID=983506 RepID=L8WSE4_THACA|nr:hypothetical protein AG1IA_06314 [Rhizoctonia solani AG-1 IA]